MSMASFIMNWIILFLLLRPLYKRVVVMLRTDAIKKHEGVIELHMQAVKKLKAKTKGHHYNSEKKQVASKKARSYKPRKKA